MKKLIINPNAKKLDTLTIMEVNPSKFIVFKRPDGDFKKGILVPRDYQAQVYFARCLDNSFAYGNNWRTDHSKSVGTISEWMQTLSNFEFYQLDTLKEVFEFAFEK